MELINITFNDNLKLFSYMKYAGKIYNDKIDAG